MTAERSGAAHESGVPRGLARWWSRIDLAAALVLVVAPLVAAFAYVRVFSVNVPYWDEWEVVSLYDAIAKGQLHFEALWNQHNEHRLLIPRSLMLILARWSRLDVRWSMYAGLIVLMGTATVLWLSTRETPLASVKGLLAFFPVTALLFSLRQWENLLWGWQVQFFLCVFFAVLALGLLASSSVSWRVLVLACAAATASSWCLAAGLSTWLAGLLVIFLRRSPLARLERGRVVLWVLSAAACLGLYMVGYQKPSYHPDVFFFVHSPLAALRYFAVTVGSALAIDARGATVMGVVILAFVAVAISIVLGKRTRSTRTVVGAGVVAFALSASVLISVGRAGSGVLAELPSRYTTFTALLILGSYLVLLDWRLGAPMTRRVVLGSFVFVVLGAEALMVPAAVSEGRSLRVDRILQRMAVQCYQSATDAEMKRTYPDPVVARDLSSVLDRLKVGPLQVPCPVPSMHP